MSPDKTVSKRQERRESIRRQEQRNRLMTIGLIVLGALFVVFAVIYPQVKPLADVVTVKAAALPNADRNSMGDPNAPIQNVEYSDFQCPYCRIFYENTEELLMTQFVEPRTVYFVYKSVGDFIGPESKTAAEAAYCAGDQV